GRVVGINSQIYSRTGGYQGVSFAIPIDVALRVKDEIVKTGKVVHARLGVTVQQLSQNLAESFKLKQPDGALVSSVTPGSAAAKAGLQPGDVILKFNNKPILASNDLPALVSMEDPGDKVTLDVWRGGKHIALNATLSEAKDSVAANDATTSDAHGGKLGVAVRALTPEEKSEANLASGVLVEQVTGRAERAGIEPGDVILAVNGTSVKTVNQLQSLVSKEGKQLALLIQRGQDKIFIPVGLG
ncbi:MAG TPA: peptidase, partial [Oxalobacteraceae bacterium]|nr:peptidase [Oxalobacteraceae bacterium]